MRIVTFGLTWILTATASAQSPATEDGGWYPFQLYRDGYLYAPGLVNGTEVEMVLDTGAGTTVLSSAFADALGLEGGARIQALGVGGKQPARLIQGVDIEVAGVALTNLTAAVIDTAEVERRIGRDMRVILGRQLFQGWVVDVDYPRERFAVREAADFAYKGPGRSIELFPRGTGWEVEAVVEGLAPARFAVDTGSGATLALFDEYTAENELLEGRTPLSDALAGGVGGDLVLVRATLESFSFAGFQLGSMPVTFHQGEKGAFGSSRAAGNLGTSVMRRFRIIFDAPHRRMHVEPGPNWSSLPFLRNRAGLQVLLDGDALEVMHVCQGSPAEAADWKAGQRVTRIDGLPIDAGYYEEVWRWHSAEVGTEVVLVDGTGAERRLVLADFY